MGRFELNLENKAEIISALDVLLASENVANLKTRKFHRNVESNRFRGLHMYFEELYNASFARIDELAERIRVLWGYAKGTFKEYLELSVIAEEASDRPSDVEMLKIIWDDKIKILEVLKKATVLAGESGDIWTESLLSGFVEAYEKDLWMLNSMDL